MAKPMKTAYVFPGQGSQWVGMGRDLYDNFPSARAIFRDADEILHIPLSQLCFEGPEDKLRLTINTQPALVVTSFAYLKITQEISKNFPMPAFVAGHSLGEYTALAAAGVLDLSTTVYLARQRGRLMHEAGLRRPGAMAAILGLDEAVVAEVCSETNTNIANFNCPGQLVISGAEADVARASNLAKDKGASRVVPMQVSGAFHSPLMRPAAEALAGIVAGLSFRDPTVPIIANTTAQPLTTAEQIKTELINQLTGSVQWQRSIEYMLGQGVSTFIEIGPGKVLTGLIKRINKEVNTVNIGDLETIKNLDTLLV